MERSNDEETDDLQRQVLQSTLQEVAARDESATDCCVICLETISDPCELVPCGHDNFDYVCVLSWLYDQPVCPLCKGNVTKVLHGPPEDRKSTVIESKPPPRAASSSTSSGSRVRYGLRYNQQFRHRHERLPRRNTTPAITASEGLQRRREVYLYQRYSKHVGTNRVSLYCELTPAIFCADNNLVSRARMWIRRELNVFSFLASDETDNVSGAPVASTTGRRRANNAEFLLEYIIAILKTVDIMGSAGQAEDMLSDFLGREHARLLLHELRAWLRSPFTKLEDWDRAVQYDPIDARERARNSSSQSHGEERSVSDAQRTWNRPRGDYYRPNSMGRIARKRRGSHSDHYRNKNSRQETGV